MSVVEQVSVPDTARPAARSLAVPPTARRAVVRTALVARLCGAVHASVATIVAPAGYGKTTLLAQWAERDGREVLGVAFEPEDDEPEAVELLLRPIAEEPALLARVDDVHVLRSPDAVAALTRTLERAPAGTTVALAGRSLPPLPLARARAEGRLVEIATENLKLTGREAESLLRLAKAPLSPGAAAALGERLEGWPAAIFLAALSLLNGTPVETLDGDDGFLADYLETEYLMSLSRVQRRFAMETAVLEELTPERCDALLGRQSSDSMLVSLERAGVAAAVDRHHRRYRCPRIVREHLLAELRRSEPERARALHRSVATDAAERGSVEEALEHATAAGDLDRTAELADRLAVSACGRGDLDSLEPWLARLRNEPSVDRRPDLCLAASWSYAVRGRPGEARHWADAASRGLSRDDPRLRLLRGLQCRTGAAQMLEDTTAACDALPAGDAWQPFATLAHGVALILTGDVARGEQALVEAVELATAAGASELKILALCVLTLVSIAENAHADADAFAAEAAEAEAVATPSASLVGLLVHATRARSTARHGDLAAAEASLAEADELLGCATPAVPWLATLPLLALAHVRLALADAAGARLLLRRVADIFRVRPELGVLVEHGAELDRQAHALSEPTGRWASSLTPAERRLLPFLATHLSFREIGTHLYISRNTVKTQAIAVYRKFGVTSRSAAIARAIDLGLIDDNTHAPGGRSQP
jgi:LuxR family transcriptional regulator, maltose regulon positive regulatory protein